jgi:hypothetical protein
MAQQRRQTRTTTLQRANILETTPHERTDHANIAR